MSDNKEAKVSKAPQMWDCGVATVRATPATEHSSVMQVIGHGWNKEYARIL